MYIYIYIYIYINIYTYLHTYIGVCVYTCMYMSADSNPIINGTQASLKFSRKKNLHQFFPLCIRTNFPIIYVYTFTRHRVCIYLYTICVYYVHIYTPI